MDQFLERRSIDDIREYFESKGLTLTLHTSSPEGTLSDQTQLSPNAERATRVTRPVMYWVSLGDVARHYGRGRTEDEAIRSAARRYRIEQAPGDTGSD